MPLLPREGPLRINCEGPTSRTFLSIVFENKERKIRWQESKCMSYDYEDKCGIALMIKKRTMKPKKKNKRSWKS